MTVLDVPGLRRRLAEARAWCAALPADATADELRTPGLVDVPTGATDEDALWRRLNDAPELTVTTAVERRAARLGDRRVSERPTTGGRVLVAEYDATLFEGATQLESRGLVDGWDVPAWDLWIGLVPRAAVAPGSRHDAPALLAWVPTALVPRADAAVCVSSTEAVTWLDVRNPRLARRLLAPGWMSRLRLGR